MKIKIDGFRAALEMLQALDPAAQEGLLTDMARMDPEMAVKLRQSLVSFDDLRYLTVSMVQRLLKDIKLENLGLALRGAKPEVVSHLMGLLSSNMKRDVEEILRGKPRALSDVLEAQKKIMDVVMALREKGEIVLSKEGSEKYV